MLEPQDLLIVGDRTNHQTTYRSSTGTCVTDTKHITGSIRGFDGRAANVLIGLDLLNAQGELVDGSGCSGPTRAQGYGVTIRLNYSAPPGGLSPKTEGVRTTWSADIPVNVTRLFLEAYPKSASDSPRTGATIHVHYGNAMRPDLQVGRYGGTISETLLPTVGCGTKLATGTVIGRFFRRGKLVDGVYASAFSEVDASGTPRGQGPFGFTVWRNPEGSHSFEMRNLASGGGRGQAYTIIAQLASGQVKQFYMFQNARQTAGVKSCQRTYFDLHF